MFTVAPLSSFTCIQYFVYIIFAVYNVQTPGTRVIRIDNVVMYHKRFS